MGKGKAPPPRRMNPVPASSDDKAEHTVDVAILQRMEALVQKRGGASMQDGGNLGQKHAWMSNISF